MIEAFRIRCAWCSEMIDLGRSIADGETDADVVVLCETCFVAVARAAAVIEDEVNGMPEPLMTARELAEHLGLATATILDWAEAGRLPHFKIGRAVRFRESEVEAWLEAQRRGPSVSAVEVVD